MLGLKQSDIQRSGDKITPFTSGVPRNAKRIAVAINSSEFISSLSDVFGRCAYFLIYDSKTNENETTPNPFAMELGGAGIQTARMLIENNIDIVITKQIGQNPLRLLHSTNIKVYKSDNLTAEEALRSFFENKLSIFEIEINYLRRKRNRNRYGGI